MTEDQTKDLKKNEKSQVLIPCSCYHQLLCLSTLSLGLRSKWAVKAQARAFGVGFPLWLRYDSQRCHAFCFLGAVVSKKKPPKSMTLLGFLVPGSFAERPK